MGSIKSVHSLSVGESAVLATSTTRVFKTGLTVIHFLREEEETKIDAITDRFQLGQIDDVDRALGALGLFTCIFA